MTFKMFNWVNERLKAQHELEFCMNMSKKYFAEVFIRPACISLIDIDTDIEEFSRKVELEIKRYSPGYYNFYLLDKTTDEKFMVYDADKYNEVVDGMDKGLSAREVVDEAISSLDDGVYV